MHIPANTSANRYSFRDKAGDYARLAAELVGLVAGERDLIARAANTAALIFDALPDINWAGFYLLRNGDLVVGPFQGKPACTRIPLGEGVCGTAAVRRQTIVVPDVQEFPGHIACDTASRSEIVIPLVTSQRVVGVLDLDSPSIARFDSIDARGLERLAAIFLSELEGWQPCDHRGHNKEVTMAVEPIPAGYHSITPYLVVNGANKVIEFLKQAFDAQELMRMPGPNNTVGHAEVKIGDSIVMMSDAAAPYPARPANLLLYVANVDQSYQRALQAGAKSEREPTDQPYGDRSAGVVDPAGNNWWIATHVKDVTPEEIKRRMAQPHS